MIISNRSIPTYLNKVSLSFTTNLNSFSLLILASLCYSLVVSVSPTGHRYSSPYLAKNNPYGRSDYSLYMPPWNDIALVLSRANRCCLFMRPYLRIRDNCALLSHAQTTIIMNSVEKKRPKLITIMARLC